MFTRAFLLLLILLSACTAAHAQNLPALVTVSGDATVFVIPDEAVLNFGVQSIKRTPEEAKKDLDARIRRIIAYVQTKGIDPKQVQTSYLQLYHNYFGDRAQNRDEYVATQTITMTLKDLANYETIISGLVSEGVNRIDGINFQTSQLQKHREEARTLAIRSARLKAEQLAKDLGQSIGAAYMIEEDGAGSPIWPEGRRMGNMMRDATTEITTSPDEGTIAAGQIPVRARVRVSFHLR